MSNVMSSIFSCISLTILVLSTALPGEINQESKVPCLEFVKYLEASLIILNSELEFTLTKLIARIRTEDSRSRKLEESSLKHLKTVSTDKAHSVL